MIERTPNSLFIDQDDRYEVRLMLEFGKIIRPDFFKREAAEEFYRQVRDNINQPKAVMTELLARQGINSGGEGVHQIIGLFRIRKITERLQEREAPQ